MVKILRVGAKRSLPNSPDGSPDSYHTAPIEKKRRVQDSEQSNSRAKPMARGPRPAVLWNQKQVTEVFIPRHESDAAEISFRAVRRRDGAEEQVLDETSSPLLRKGERYRKSRAIVTSLLPPSSNHSTMIHLSGLAPEGEAPVFSSGSDTETRRLEKKAKRQRRRQRRHAKYVEDTKDLTEQMRRVSVAAERRVLSWLDGVAEEDGGRVSDGGEDDEMDEMAVDGKEGALGQDLVDSSSSTGSDSSDSDKDEQRGASAALSGCEAGSEQDGRTSSEESDWQSEGERMYYLRF